MRGGFITAFGITVLLAGGYFYIAAQAICPIPLSYRVGDIDERFGISHEELRSVVEKAEEVWEKTSGRELFVYDENSNFTINLVYDDRQAFTDAEMEERARLENTESASGAIQNEYDKLVSQYDTLQKQYEEAVESYKKDLSAYNEEVSYYNVEGGAPAEVYDQLEKEKSRLETEQMDLEKTIVSLNGLVEQINMVGERGNNLIDTYNRGVDQFNNTFNTHREFTQGTYRSDGRIDIYTFTDPKELKLVVAHELGHALSIDHVAGSESVMYFMIGEQLDDLVPSEYDMIAFTEVCRERSFWDTIVLGFNTSFNLNT